MGTAVVAFKAVAPLFLAIFAGMAFSRSKTVTENWIDTLNNYALKIGLPALVIASLIKIDSSSGDFAKLVFVNSVWFVVSMLLAFPVARVFKLSHQVRAALVMIFSYGNVAYLGIPVLKNTYGDTAIPIAGVISSVYIFWLLTLGMFLIEINSNSQINIRLLAVRQLKNPLLISVFAGMFLVFFKIELPVVVTETIGLFAGSVTAVVLFSLGIFLGFHKTGNLKDWLQALVFSVVILLVLPAIFWVAAVKTGLSSLPLKASVLESAMPLGLTPYAIATQYKIESPLVARIVVVSTLLSVFTIPVWIIFLK